jgi:hypothetical protein
MTKVAPDADTITVRIPFMIRKRGGRKLVLAPDGRPRLGVARRMDNATIKALARAFRWRRMLGDGSYHTVGELAQVEKINPSYVGRVLRLTLLAPDIVTSILDCTHPPSVSLALLMKPFSAGWREQRHQFGAG